MSYGSTAEPIKIGYLMDFLLPTDCPQHLRDDLTNPFDMVFCDALEQGHIDRPEIVYREVEGLPKGTVKAVVDAYAELVDEGCLAIFEPHTGDNAVAIREAIIERFRVPAISVTGSDEGLCEWFFSFPMGSHFDGVDSHLVDRFGEE
jgi:branched-chain amino acid transport system substrate-binding protein